jgi:SsrA-binding protein
VTAPRLSPDRGQPTGRPPGAASEAPRKVVCTNRKARHRYRIEETIEAGIELRGPEVKSLRAGQASLSDSYARIRRGEVFLVKTHIAPYAQATRENPAPERERRLLLHRREIDRLEGKVRERGLTLVPLEIYFKAGRAKVSLALARGKRVIDRREDIARREAERRILRATRRRSRGR